MAVWQPAEPLPQLIKELTGRPRAIAAINMPRLIWRPAGVGPACLARRRPAIGWRIGSRAIGRFLAGVR